MKNLTTESVAALPEDWDRTGEAKDMRFGRHQLTRSAGGAVESVTSEAGLPVLIETDSDHLPSWCEPVSRQPCDSLITIRHHEPPTDSTDASGPIFEHVSFASKPDLHQPNATMAVTAHREHLDKAAEAMAFLLASEQLMVCVDWSELRELLGPRQPQVHARCWVEPGPVTDDSARALGWKQNALTVEGFGRASIIVGLISWPDLPAFDLATVETLYCVNYVHLARDGDGVTTAAVGSRQSATVLFAFR